MRHVFRFAVDHPFWTVGIVTAVAIAFLIPLQNMTQETDWREFLNPDDPIIRLMDEAEEKYGRTLGIMVMLINDEEGLFNEESLLKIDRMAKAFEEIPGVLEVVTPFNSQVITATEDVLNIRYAAPNGEAPRTPEEIAAFRERLTGSRMLEGNIISSNGKAASISIELAVGADEYAVTERIVEVIEPFNDGEDEVYIYGDAYFDVVVSQEMETDLTILFPAALVLMVGVLFLSFMNLRGILIPIGIVLLSICIAMGFMTLVGFPMTMVSFITPVLLLAIGIADGIHVLNRYNEEIGKGIDRRQAILNTMEEMKGPVVMTSLTTAAGFLSLVSSFFLPQRQFGIVTALGVLAAMVFSLVLIPAILAVLKPPKVRKKGSFRPLTRVLLTFERVVARRRRWVLVLAVGVLAFMLAGLPMLRIETSNEEFLGKDHPAIQILNKVDEHFSGGMQIMIEVDTGTRSGLKDTAVLARMLDIEEFLKENGVLKTISLTDLVREMNQKLHADDPAYYTIPEDRRVIAHLLGVFTGGGGKLGDMALGNFSAGTIMGLYPMASTSDISRLSRTVQDYLDETFAGSDLTVRMVGATILMGRLMTRMNQSQLIGLGTTVVAVAILVSVLMGSVIAGLIAIIPLVLTVAISTGIMAYTGTPLDMMTLMVSAIAVGIGVDYSIHFISRFRREYRTDGDPILALQNTIQTTGRGITYNALTVSLGFFILVFASFKGIRSFGLQIALTMAVSALAAISLIPAILVERQPRFLARAPWARKVDR